MKKIVISIIIIIIVVTLSIKTLDTRQVFIEKINLNLESDEIALTFLNYDIGKYILINTNANKLLLVLNKENIEELKTTLSVFNANEIDYLLLTEDNELEINYIQKQTLGNFNIDDFIIHKNNNFITLTYGKNIFNIYIKPINSIEGNFIYLLFNPEEHIELEEDIHIIFYLEDLDLQNSLMEEIYSKWIDLYKIKEGEWTTLKLKKDNYKMITIPNEK